MHKFIPVLALVGLLAAGCGAAATPDIRTTQTQVAASIFATQTADVPTPTLTPYPTYTPYPTLTPVPSATPMVVPTNAQTATLKPIYNGDIAITETMYVWADGKVVYVYSEPDRVQSFKAWPDGTPIGIIMVDYSTQTKSRWAKVQTPDGYIGYMPLEYLSASVRVALPKPIPYNELARNTESWVGKTVLLYGRVIQVLETGSDIKLRVNVTEGTYGWTDTVFVRYTGPRLLENDIIVFAAKVNGRITYQTVLGAQVTVPDLTAIDVTRR